MNYKIKYLFLISLFFIGCNSDDVTKVSVQTTCKDISKELNSTYLDSNLSPIDKNITYLVEKNRFIIQPTNNSVITLTITDLDLNGDDLADCTTVIQSATDLNSAEILLK